MRLLFPIAIFVAQLTTQPAPEIRQVENGFTVSGRIVHDETRAGESMPRITLSGNGGTTSASVKPDGAFDFRKLPSGTYGLTIFSDPLDSHTIVVDRDISGIEVVLPWMTIVQSRLALDTDGPRPVITLSFKSSEMAKSDQLLNSLQTRLQEGTYSVAATAVPTGFFVKSVAAGGLNLLTVPLRIAKNTKVPEIVVTLGVSDPNPWVKFSGRITASHIGFRRVSIDGYYKESLSADVGADGAFEFSKTLPGDYRFTISPEPVLFVPVIVTVPPGGLNGVEIYSPPEQSVRGRITIEGGGPLPALRLQLKEVPAVSRPAPDASNPSQSGVKSIPNRVRNADFLYIDPFPVGADGRFGLALPYGQYRLEVAFRDAPDSSPYFVKAFTYSASDLLQNPLTVAELPLTEELKVVLAPKAESASFRVTGTIRLDRKIGQGPPSIVLANGLYKLTTPIFPDGSFEFSKVFPGRYNLDYWSSDVQASVQIEVQKSNLDGVEFPLPQRRELKGRVVLEGDGPFPAFSLFVHASDSKAAIPWNYSGSAFIKPESDGTFMMTLPESSIQPPSLPNDYTLKSITYGKTNLSGNPLKFSTPEEELRIVIAVKNRSSHKVRGRVTGLDMTLLNPGSIQVELLSAPGVPPVPIERDGTFEFPQVLSGRHFARVSPRGPNVTIFGGTALTVADKDIEDLILPLPRQRILTGKIVIEGNGPIPHPAIPISVLNPETNARTTISVRLEPIGLDGSFKTVFPEGPVGPITSLPSGYVLKSITYGNGDLTVTPLKFPAEGSPEMLIVLSANARSVRFGGKIRVLNPAVFPERSEVLMFQVGGGTFQTAAVGADGSFDFPEIATGKYEALFGAARAFVVVPEGGSRNAELIFDPQQSIAGRVRVEGGGPVPHIDFNRVPSSITFDSGLMNSGFSVIPATDGTFKYMALLGEYQMVTPDGYTVKSARFGSSDLTHEALKLDGVATGELSVTVSTSGTPRSVSGRVKAQKDSSLPDRTVYLASISNNARLTAPIAADGTFEFPSVYPGDYQAYMATAAGTAVPHVNFSVSDKNISGIEVTYP